MKRTIVICMLLCLYIFLYSCGTIDFIKTRIENKDVLLNNSDSHLTTAGVTNEPNSVIEMDKLSNIKEMYNNLKILCEEPRPIESEAIENAKEYITKKMNQYGYTTDVQTFNFLKVSAKERTEIKTAEEYFSIQFKGEENDSYATNIIAKKNFVEDKRTLYLCAHYDTTRDTNGEIDNGSGVVTILDIARKLSEVELPVNLVLVFFSAEETGMSGSSYFVKQLSEEERKNTIGCINFDCVCQNIAEREVYKNIFDDSENALSILLNEFYPFKYGNSNGSDHRSFYYGEIANVSFTDNIHVVKDNENTPMKNVNLEQIDKLTNILGEFILTFDIEKYEDMIKGGYEEEYTIKQKTNSMMGYSLEEAKQILIEGGYKSKFQYTFINKDNNRLVLMKDNRIIVESKEIQEILKGKTYNNIKYYTKEISSNSIEIHYVVETATQEYGILTGNISEEAALIFLEKTDDVLLSDCLISDLIQEKYNINE